MRAKMKDHQERRMAILMTGLEEMKSVTEHQKPLKKGLQWRTDMGMGI
jgi:hypothetical protein